MKIKNKYWKTDSVFIEKFLDVLEESINLNPNLQPKQKDLINTIFYTQFYECKKDGNPRKNVELQNFRWNFKGFTKKEMLNEN